MSLHNHPRTRVIGFAHVWVEWEEGCFACKHRTIAELLRALSRGRLT